MNRVGTVLQVSHRANRGDGSDATRHATATTAIMSQQILQSSQHACCLHCSVRILPNTTLAAAFRIQMNKEVTSEIIFFDKLNLQSKNTFADVHDLAHMTSVSRI